MQNGATRGLWSSLFLPSAMAAVLPRSLLGALCGLALGHALPAQANWVPKSSLGGREGSAMVWDTARDRVVLFGGMTSKGESSETWEWDGTSWTQRFPAVSPPPLWEHAMAYDERRQRVVVFGGFSAGSPSSSTWEWDGWTWREIHVIHPPPQRVEHSMAYDPVNQNVVLFGGSDGTWGLGDMWMWDGRTWSQHTGYTPSSRWGHAMVTDTGRGRIVLHGGRYGYRGGKTSSTWEWDGVSWTLLSPSPRARAHHAMAYDSVRGRVVLFGLENLGTRFVDYTWEWDGNSWTVMTPLNSGPPRSHHAMAYDPVRRVTILQGGRSSTQGERLSDTWAYDGARWSQGSSASPVNPSSMAYDSARRLVVARGYAGYSTVGQTWEWDGTVCDSEGAALGTGGWRRDHGVRRCPPTDRSLSDCAVHQRAADLRVHRRVLVQALLEPVSAVCRMHGLRPRPTANGVGQLRDGLGMGWRRLDVVFHPAGTRLLRGGHGVRRTEQADGLVRRPGLQLECCRGDVGLEGPDLDQALPPQSPPARYGHAMVYHRDDDRIVLVGGRTGSGFMGLDDIWEWDGTTWTEQSRPIEPSEPYWPAMAYDAARERTVLALASRTWTYGNSVAAQALPIGSPCSGTAGTPHLEGRGRPWLGNAAFGVDVASLRPAAPVAVLLASTPGNLPLGGGCTLYVDPSAVAVGVSANSVGLAQLGLPIPNLPGLMGVTFHVQAVAHDPAGAFLGLAFTRGLNGVVGE